MKKISKYQIFFELQHGPVTRVYKAFQLELQRPVLVKQLNPDRMADEQLVERFRQEGLILAKINSPHVITVFDFGFEDGVPFLVTEFIEGTTLAELIQRHSGLPWDIGLFILQQLAQGLMAIHHHQIVHRDIKPENIFISAEGDVKLGDLGFSTPLTLAEQAIQGTPAYLAPEIVLGEPVDFRSDLYSLGLVGYEMLTGQNPFASDSISVVFNRIVNVKPLPIHKVRSDVPEGLSHLIAKLMARQPVQRFQTVKDFLQAFDEWKISQKINIAQDRLINFLEHPDQYQPLIVRPEKPLPVSSPKARRHRVPALVIASFIVVIILIFIGKQLTNDLNLSPAASDTSRIVQPEEKIEASESGTPSDVSDKQKQQREQPPYAIRGGDEASVIIFKRADSLQAESNRAMRPDTMMITADPRAFVYRKGTSLGITPVKLAVDGREDTLTLSFHSPGFPVIQKTVKIASQGAQNIHMNLWKEVGYFEINIVPWGEVWIDGDSIDVTPLNHPIILAPGNHKLMVRHPRLKSIAEPFYIAAGETLKKSYQLQRAP